MSENANTDAVRISRLLIAFLVVAAVVAGLMIGVTTNWPRAGRSYTDCILRNLDSAHSNWAIGTLTSACKDAHP